MARLIAPPVPAALRAHPTWLLGSAARLRLGGAPLHQPPELGVALDVTGLLALGAQANERADCLTFAGWQLVPEFEPTAAQLARRGFAVDAFALASSGDLVDPFDGLADLRAGRVRLLDAAWLKANPVGATQGLALASELAASPDAETEAAIADAADGVLRADRRDLRDALTRLLVGRRPGPALEALLATGILALVLPEVAALEGFHRSSPRHHKDVWAHTVQVVCQAVPRPAVRWAALLHDIAKVHTRSVDPEGAVHFLRHEEVGALQVEGITHRLRFAAEDAERVRALVQHHLRANLYHPSYGDAALRRMQLEVGPAMEELLLLSRADVTSKRPGRRRAAMANLHHLSERLRLLAVAEARSRPVLPRGLGAALIAAFQLPPGPTVGGLRARCEQAARDGRLPELPTIEACVAWLRSVPDLDIEARPAPKGKPTPGPQTH